MTRHTDDIAGWLNTGAPGADAPQEVLRGLAERLVATGVPLQEAVVFVATLHPNVLGRRFTWTADGELSVREEPFRDPAASDPPTPFHAVIESGAAWRCRLAEVSADDYATLGDGRVDHPVLTVFLLQAIGAAEHTSEITDVLTESHHAWVFRSFCSDLHCRRIQGLQSHCGSRRGHGRERVRREGQ